MSKVCMPFRCKYCKLVSKMISFDGLEYETRCMAQKNMPRVYMGITDCPYEGTEIDVV